MLLSRITPLIAGIVIGAAIQTVAFAAPPQFAQRPVASQAQTNELADAIARNDGDWRGRLRTYLQSPYPDRGGTTDRAIELLKVVNQKCLASTTCPPNVLTEIATMAKGAVCAAHIIDSVCVRRFNVPRGAQAFDFGPVGQPVYPGMRAVSPVDPRLTGTSMTAVRYNDAYPASGDSIIGISSFKTPFPAGKVRIVLIGGKRPLAQALTTPFGRTIEANGRSLEVMAVGPDRWLPRGALANGTPDQVFTPNNVLPGSAPAVVFDVDHRGGDLVLNFPQSAEIGALLIEPANQGSGFVLDSTAQSMGPVSNAACLEQESRIDRALAELPQDIPGTNCPGGVCRRPPADDPCPGICKINPLSAS